MGDDEDRDAILKRRSKFIAVTLASMTSLTACGSDEPEPQACLNVVVPPPETEPQPCLSPVTPMEQIEPQPCLDIAIEDDPPPPGPEDELEEDPPEDSE